MNIVKLQIVVLIEKYKKVTDVAAELGIKQPTVSFHMKSLEAELGTPLFQYRGGRVLLTDAGRALHQYAVRIVTLTAEAERSVRQFSSLSSGNLALEASFIPATYLLPKMLAKFIGQHPGIDTSLSIQSDAVIRERLRSRETELAVLHGTEGQEDTFHTRIIAKDETVLICTPGHPLKSLAELTPEQIAREPWIQHAAPSFLRAFSDQWVELNHVRPWNHVELDSPEAFKRLICEGGSMGLFSKAGIEEELLSGRLCSLPLPGVQPQAGSFMFAWRKDHTLSPLQQAFITSASEDSSE